VERTQTAEMEETRRAVTESATAAANQRTETVKMHAEAIRTVSIRVRVATYSVGTTVGVELNLARCMNSVFPKTRANT